MQYLEMPDLSLKALAVLYQLKGNSRANKPSDFLAKEALASFASRLNEDDVGFFYDPEKVPEICTHPGQLVGRIANSRLPYHFGFSKAIETFAGVLNFLDDSYHKLGVVITDCFEDADADTTADFLSSIKGDVYVFGIGPKSCFSLQNACQLANVKYCWLADIDLLEGKLKLISL